MIDIRKIIINEKLIVDRTGYMCIFCHVEGKEPYILRQSPWYDVLLRMPSLCTTLEYPEETIFNEGDKINVTIELVSSRERIKNGRI